MNPPQRPILLLTLLLASASLFAQKQPNPPVDAGALTPVQRVDYLGQGAGREPSIVEHPDGTLFVTGYSSMATGELQKIVELWKSSDHGTTWKPVDLGGETAGALGNSDVSLAAAPDGTLYLVSMQFDGKTVEGVHIDVGVSTNTGSNWHWTMLSKKRYVDRPWVAVAPDGAAHIIWNDGTGVYHTVTRDRGQTWSAPQAIHPDGGSSFLAIGPKGEIAVRIVPMSASGNKYTEGVDLIAVSTDGGSTWQKGPAPGERDWAPMDTTGATPRWIEPLAWDAQGSLYSLWTNFHGVWLAKSSDRGATWHEFKVSDIDELSYYPFLSARGDGELAATWFSGAGEELHWRVSHIQVQPGSDQLKVSKSSPLQSESWGATDQPDHMLVRSSAGEYIPVIFLRDGTLAVITPIQNKKEKRFGFTYWNFKRQ